MNVFRLWSIRRIAKSRDCKRMYEYLYRILMTGGPDQQTLHERERRLSLIHIDDLVERTCFRTSLEKAGEKADLEIRKKYQNMTR